MSDTIDHWLDGKRWEGSGSRRSPVFDPATGAVTGEVRLADAADVDAAVASSRAAFDGWRASSLSRRTSVLFELRRILSERRDEFARVISSQHGKVRSDAAGEVQRGLEVVEFACGIPQLLKGGYTEQASTEVDVYSIRQPVGVAVGITPFNFPAMVPLWMCPVAIACGNTFILKPSEKDPSLSLRMAELLKEAGLPDGVLNVVNGDKEVVDVLLTDPRVGAVSFVGSTPIAQYIYATASAHGKRVQALGGAKNHMVVMPDADLDQAVSALMGAAYGAAGERCMAISVAVVVGDETADALVAKLTPLVEKLRVGPGLGQSPENEMGPLISKEHLAKVRGYVDQGVTEGAALRVDGRTLSHDEGYFIGGCLFDEVTPEMRIYREEIFGPVLSIVRVPDYETALRLINEHEYGNGTAIFTCDGDTARDFTARVQVGMVGVNVPIPVPMAFHSFGGWKRSIFGPLNMHGPDGVRFYTRMKTVTARWPQSLRSGAEFSMPTMK